LPLPLPLPLSLPLPLPLPPFLLHPCPAASIAAAQAQHPSSVLQLWSHNPLALLLLQAPGDP
jgi:hypothetical protein